MSRGKKWFIGIAIVIAIFAPATFAMILDKGITAVFTIFNTSVEQLNKIPTTAPTP